ncbi:MAG: Clp protease N-terminal domain-containing protein, partial [Moraxella sp.]
MQFDKFTHALQSALQQAQTLAVTRDHTAIEPIHLLSILLDEPSNANIFEQAGANLTTLKTQVQQSLANQAVIGTPTGEVSLSPNSVKVLNLAERHAQKAGD